MAHTIINHDGNNVGIKCGKYTTGWEEMEWKNNGQMND